MPDKYPFWFDKSEKYILNKQIYFMEIYKRLPEEIRCQSKPDCSGKPAVWRMMMDDTPPTPSREGNG